MGRGLKEKKKASVPCCAEDTGCYDQVAAVLELGRHSARTRVRTVLLKGLLSEGGGSFSRKRILFSAS